MKKSNDNVKKIVIDLNNNIKSLIFIIKNNGNKDSNNGKEKNIKL